MKNFMITITILLIVAVVSASMSNTSSDLSKLSHELKTLQNKFTLMQTIMARFVKERDTRNGICQIKQNPCGDSCLCVEDYSLMEKYFCDCRAQPTRRDCKEHHLQGERINGLYKINKNINGYVIQVFCDQITDGGGWTVVQRRMDGSENFFRNWTEYKLGFGQLHREHWLGNENIYLLTAQAFFKGSEVRFDMMAKDQSNMKWAKYSSFEVDNEPTGYTLHVSGFSGNVEERFTFVDGMKFTTYDRDQDKYTSGNCAVYSYGAGWYNICNYVNINGQYDRFQRESDTEKVLKWHPHRLTFVEMKIRRK